MAEPADQAEPRHSLRDLLETLVARGLLEPDKLAAIADHLELQDREPHSPWYIQAFLGFSGWVAAICFMIFLGLAGLLGGGSSTLVIWGILLTGAGIGLRARGESIFVLQLALAFNIAGKALILTGMHDELDASWSVPLTSVLLLLITYPLSRDPVDRFVTTLGTVSLTTGWLISEPRLHPMLHLLLGLEMVGTGYLFMRHHSRVLAPLGYALAVGLLATLVLPLVMQESLDTPWWPSRLVLMGGLVALYAWAAGDPAHLRREPLIVALVTTALLGLISTPGVLAAIALLVLGYARDDRLLLGMAFAFLPVFIVLFYYFLDVDLATKSWALLGSGLLLLGARAYLSRRPWAQEGA